MQNQNAEPGKEGLTFLDAHSPSAVCTPTRYGVLTGRYNWRSRLAKGVLGGTSTHLIPADRPTVAHLLHKANYHNQMIGKWHLGWDWAILPNEAAPGNPVSNDRDVKFLPEGSSEVAPDAEEENRGFENRRP